MQRIIRATKWAFGCKNQRTSHKVIKGNVYIFCVTLSFTLNSTLYKAPNYYLRFLEHYQYVVNPLLKPALAFLKRCINCSGYYIGKIAKSHYYYIYRTTTHNLQLLTTTHAFQSTTSIQYINYQCQSLLSPYCNCQLPTS